MTPSKEAIEAVESFALEIQDSNFFWKRDVLSRAIECAYAIDIEPLELCYSLLQKERDCDGQTIKDLEQRIAELEWKLQSSERANVGMQEIITKLEAELAPLQKRFEIVSELSAERGMENDELKERVKELEADVAKYKSFGTENEELELRLKELEADALKASQECCRSAKAEMKEVIAGLVIKTEEQNGRIKELEAENQRLGEQLAHFKDCYSELASKYDKAQLERAGGDVE